MLEGKQCRHFNCMCGSEMIQIEREENEIYFAIYLHGIINHEYSLRERLKHIWQILVHKKPYSDFAILNLEEAKRMGETLIKMTKDAQNVKECTCEPS